MQAAFARAGRPVGDVDIATAAWLAVVPAAALATLAVLVLGPPLGRLLPVSALRFWPELQPVVRPEPTEQGRYLLALSAPLLLAAFTAVLARRAPAALTRSAARAAMGVELAVALFVGVCLVVQRTANGQDASTPVPYFSVATLIVAAALAAVLAALARSPRAGALWSRLAAESLGRRFAVALAAGAAVVVTLLPALNTDHSIAFAHEQVYFHLQFVYDETAAVLDGRSPLGDFAPQYASLLPYALAAALALLGTSLAIYTTLLALLTGAGLLALFAVLRRVARSSLAALLVFLPLLATSAWHLRGESVARFSLINYPGMMPMRTAGPFVLAWLVARHLDGAAPRRLWSLFLLAGLVAINNLDFGIPAVGATIAALLWARQDRRARAAAEAALGLGGALALVTLLLLARTGAPPQLSLLTSYQRLFAQAGFGMFPIRPLLGFEMVIFLTYVAAIGVATMRALRGAAEWALTGMLAWSGVFGLGAGAYYVGRSRAEQLIYMFPIWAFALTLLTLVTLRWIARRERRPTVSMLACLAGFGLLVCSLAQTPAPWAQVRRIARTDGAPVFARPAGQAFVAPLTRRGEHVVITSALGHRIAYNLGLVDVEPFTGQRSIQTADQLERSLRALRKAGGGPVFVWFEQTYASWDRLLLRTYRPVARDANSELQMWVPR